MRILSQDGMIDVPYEQVVIQRFREKIYFLNKNLTGVENLVDDMEIAKYSTEAKAKRAMEMLREAYCGIVKVSKEIIDMEVKKIAEEIRNGFIQPMPTQETKVECKYFQFPPDEELEV